VTIQLRQNGRIGKMPSPTRVALNSRTVQAQRIIACTFLYAFGTYNSKLNMAWQEDLPSNVLLAANDLVLRDWSVRTIADEGKRWFERRIKIDLQLLVKINYIMLC
ncbi:MAG: hypothetical protein ACTILG_10485, partial [Sphingobacterium sp.]